MKVNLPPRSNPCAPWIPRTRRNTRYCEPRVWILCVDENDVAASANKWWTRCGGGHRKRERRGKVLDAMWSPSWTTLRPGIRLAPGRRDAATTRGTRRCTHRAGCARGRCWRCSSARWGTPRPTCAHLTQNQQASRRRNGRGVNARPRRRRHEGTWT